MILGKLKADAEAKLGEKITQTMITVPAYFKRLTTERDKGRRQDCRHVGASYYQRPTAASLAYGLETRPGIPRGSFLDNSGLRRETPVPSDHCAWPCEAGVNQSRRSFGIGTQAGSLHCSLATPT
jgi:hypothetical protein